MIDYGKMYKLLFNKITDAIKDIEEHNYGLAKERLINAQKNSEDIFVRSNEIYDNAIQYLN